MNRVALWLDNSYRATGEKNREFLVAVQKETAPFPTVYLQENPNIGYSPKEMVGKIRMEHISILSSYLEIGVVERDGLALPLLKKVISSLAKREENLGVLIQGRDGKVINPFSLEWGKEDLNKIIDDAQKIVVYDLKKSFFEDFEEALKKEKELLDIKEFLRVRDLFRSGGKIQAASEQEFKVRFRAFPYEDLLSREVSGSSSRLREGYYITALSIGDAEFSTPLYGIGIYRLSSNLRGVSVLGAFTTNTDWFDGHKVCTGDEPSNSISGLNTTRGAYYGSVYESNKAYQPAMNYLAGLVIKNMVLQEHF